MTLGNKNIDTHAESQVNSVKHSTTDTGPTKQPHGLNSVRNSTAEGEDKKALGRRLKSVCPSLLCHHWALGMTREQNNNSSNISNKHHSERENTKGAV